MDGSMKGWEAAAVAKDVFDLKLKRALLEGRGIPTYAASDFANELYGLTRAPLMPWKGPDPFTLMVPADRLEEARGFLDLPDAPPAEEEAILVLLDWRHRALLSDGEFPRGYADVDMDDFLFLGDAESPGATWRFFLSEKGSESFELVFPRRFVPVAPLLREFPGLREAYSRVVLSGYEVDAPIYEVFGFAGEPRAATRLGKLALSGRKTATSSALRELEEEGEEPPVPGSVSIVVDGRGRPLCAIETVSVEILPFSEVGPEHARAEGEGDLSLDYWRKVHRACFGAGREGGAAFRDSDAVVCERFRTIKVFG